MKKQIELSRFSVSLGDRVLYNNLDLTLHEGDRFIFLGPNGVGKSLLLELMAFGFTGEIKHRYKGIHISGQMNDAEGNDLLDPRNREKPFISYASQNEDFYNNSTIFDEAETACHGVGIELDEGRLDYLLDRFGILEKKKQKIRNNVSFGEGKLIHLVTRLLKLRKVNILLLDEPLNHLSFQNSRILNEIIAEEISRNSSLSIIMVSHCRAVNFTDRALVYDRSIKGLSVVPYKSYDCFASLGCLDSPPICVSRN